MFTKLRNFLILQLSLIPAGPISVAHASASAGETTAQILNKLILPLFMWLGILIFVPVGIVMLVLFCVKKKPVFMILMCVFFTLALLGIVLRPILAAILTSVQTPGDVYITF